MNENINLCELLKGHEGEKFYSPLTQGNITLKKVRKMLVFEEHLISLDDKGAFYPNGECMIFPSKEQRDWNKWTEEQNPKVPKTWSDIEKYNLIYDIPEVGRCSTKNGIYIRREHLNSVEKSALALLKIHQLIEIGYGGNVTNEEWDYTNWKYKIYVSEYNEIKVCSISYKFPILFHTKEQAKEFLSYPENAQLIKDFYMI